ncbi:MAG: hypothetical protein ACKV2V_30200 [Blastocatellia bacterium]
MINNLVSATLTDADLNTILAALEVVKQKLPFLVNLTRDELRAMPKAGDSSMSFIAQTLEIATRNPDIVPAVLSVEEMRRDVALANQLQPVLLALTQLQELVSNTHFAATSEAYSAALAIYSLAKMTGKAAGLQDTTGGLGKKFARKTTSKQKQSAQKGK